MVKYKLSYDRGWSGPTPLGPRRGFFSPGSIVSALGSKLDHSNTHRIDIYALGVDGYVYYKTWKDGSGWEEWYLVPGSYPGTPNVSTAFMGRDLGRNYIFIVLPNGEYWVNRYDY